MSKSSQKGITLIEIVVTASVLAILAAIALPSFRLWLASIQIRGTSESLQNGIKLAQTEALRRNTPVTFWLITTPTACAASTAGLSWIVSAENALSTACAGTDTNKKIQSHDGASAASVVNVAAAGGSCVTFNALGQISTQCIDGNDPITAIALTPQSSVYGAKSLNIEMSAHPRVCDPLATAGTSRACN